MKSFNSSIGQAYVICLPGDVTSMYFAQRCLASCAEVQQPAELWPGFDGRNDEIITPQHLHGQSWINWIKIMDHFQSKAEMACSLSHISLWAHCMTTDQPLIVLEHDAVMTKRLMSHPFYNTVQYLGHQGQASFDISKDDVPMSSINQNWLFINRAHAYSIDPPAARRLFGMVLDRGIFESLDVMIQADAVAIVQLDVYAHDDPRGMTTITQRKLTGQHGPGEIKL